MCNLIAFSGYHNDNRSVKEIELKIKFLLATAKERGDDGVGLFANGIRKVGFNERVNAVYTDTSCPMQFALKVEFDNLNFETDNVVLAHNRKSSFGGITKDAIHPYLYEYENESLLAFMHNGTIRNTTEIGTKYGFAIREYTTDSELLGLILYHKGLKEFKKVLASYEGGANFIWHYTWEPNVIYVWKGASNTEYTLNGVVKKSLVEDRPLFYGIDDETGLYINSTDLPLKAIGLTNVKSFDNNTITVIENGQVTRKIKINRDVKFSTATTVYGNTHTHWRAGVPANNSYANNSTPDSSLFKHLSNPHNKAQGGIYWYNGLYYNKGSVCDGIYYFNKRGRLTRNPGGKVTETLYFLNGFWVSDYATYQECLITKNANPDPSIYKPTIAKHHKDSIQVMWTTVYKGGSFLCTISSVKSITDIIEGRFLFFDYEVVAGTLVEGTSYKLDKYGYKAGVRDTTTDVDDLFTDYEQLEGDYPDNWDEIDDRVANRFALKKFLDTGSLTDDEDDDELPFNVPYENVRRSHIPRVVIHDDEPVGGNSKAIVKYLPPVVVDTRSSLENRTVQNCIDYYNEFNMIACESILEVNNHYRNDNPDFKDNVLFNDIESLEVFIHNCNYGTALKKDMELVCAYKFDGVNNY